METWLKIHGNKLLENLNAQEAVELFRDLLWAEAASNGISLSQTNVSTSINVPDGGIDAFVYSDVASRNGIVDKGNNGYQIKTGRNFNPNRRSDIAKELFRNKAPSLENLAPAVKSCLDQNGKYVLVYFGKDLTDTERKEAIQLVNEYLLECGFSSPRVDIWSINNLIGYFEQFPPLVVRINHTHDFPCFTHYEWSIQDSMRTSYIPGQIQQEMIDQVRKQLQRIDMPVHIRILGEAGIGKTRFVLEVTDTPEFRSLVIYTTASQFENSSLLNELIRNTSLYAIVVVDECDPDQRARIWNNLKNISPRIKIISIYNESDISDLPTFELPELGNDQISSIIQTYGISEFDANQWAPACGGSPRVAHMLGANLRSNPEDILKSPSTVNIWNRYIWGTSRSDDPSAKQKKLVLQYIALFKRFGYRTPLVDEARAIHKLIQEADPQITWQRFQEIVMELENQRVLQGEITLYITPKLLHIKLWLDWWNTYGDGFDIDRIAEFPPKLIEWFMEMFEYAAGSPAASSKVKEMLGKGGMFQGDLGSSLKTRLGARFFLHLARAEPTAALSCLEQTLGRWSKDELLKFEQTRSEIVNSLEYIATWEDLFTGAARLLLKLGEAENQTWSNNASGVFTELFSLSVDERLSLSEAPPEKRFLVLREALESPLPAYRKLALRACEKALSWADFGMITQTNRIVGKKPKLWYPKTYGELSHAYMLVWNLLLSHLDKLPDDQREEAARLLVRSVSNLGRFQDLSDEIISGIKFLYENLYIPREEIIPAVVNLLHDLGSHLVPEDRNKWQELEKQLLGENYHDQLLRYISLNLITDMLDENGSLSGVNEKKIVELANYGLSHQAELKEELDWLWSKDFPKSRQLAYEIGKLDKGLSFLPDLLKAVRRSNKSRLAAIFLGNYLQTLFLDEKAKGEELVLSFEFDIDLAYAAPFIVLGTKSLTDSMAELILRLAKANQILNTDLGLFVYGKYLESMSEKIFRQWLEFLLLENETATVIIALELEDNYYVYSKSLYLLPEDISLQILTHKSLFTPFESLNYDQMASFHWENIAGVFIEQYSTRALELSEIILENIGEFRTLVSGLHAGSLKVLGKIAQKMPNDVWHQITKYLNPPYDAKAFSITQWLRGDQMSFEDEERVGLLIVFPQETIWKWVEEDVDQRAWYLATFVPKALYREDGKICWARELLIRYGDRKDVRDNLIANFSSGSWSGPASQYFAMKKQRILEYRKTEDDPRVISWLDEFVETIDQDIQQSKIREERREI